MDIKGEVYCITNRATGRVYIGQTLTHRKNRGVHKPFGTLGRFKDHVSEALCNTKQNQCWYLNAAIRKYGADQFEVQRIETCERATLDERERFYIAQRNSLYPNGYNLTPGGRTLQSISVERDTKASATTRTRGGCDFRGDETRLRIGKALRDRLASNTVRQTLAERTRQQHLSAKREAFKDVQLDPTTLDAYIRQQKTRVVVVVGDKQITFAGKHSTPDQRYTQARTFLLQFCDASKLTGTPLESHLPRQESKDPAGSGERSEVW